jgi:hypothetical protein
MYGGTYHNDRELRVWCGSGGFHDIYGQALGNGSALFDRGIDISLTVFVCRCNPFIQFVHNVANIFDQLGVQPVRKCDGLLRA